MFGLMSSSSHRRTVESQEVVAAARNKQIREHPVPLEEEELSASSPTASASTALMTACINNLEHDVREILDKKVWRTKWCTY